jgi:uncharacterized protein
MAAMRARIAALIAILLTAGCGTAPPAAPPAGQVGGARPNPGAPSKADEFLVVDCLLPAPVRKLGSQFVYQGPRRPIKTSARDCEIRGGEYTAYDRADYRTALKVWMAQADQGDPAAQTYVGEIYEKGLGVAPDYEAAARWYRRAADANYPRAAINLGSLYERGLGVPRDPAEALKWYRKGAGGGGAALEIVYADAAGKPPGGPAAGAPRIELVEPELLLAAQTRDIRITPSAGSTAVAIHTAPTDDLTLVGRVIAQNPLRSVTINGKEEAPDGRTVFQARIRLRQSEERVRIVATDRAGLTSSLEFLVLNRPPSAGAGAAPDPTRPVAPGTTYGRYHALVIGNNDYRLIRPLRTAVNDARDIATVLEQQYGFKVTLLLNANRYDILSALNALRATLTEDDNLLVYYAGHGQLDRVNQRGHWLPVDAEPDSPANWISNISVTDILNAMTVQQLLVVADSCYSGAMTRSAVPRVEPGMTDDARAQALRTLARKRSRLLLTSGGVEPVVDTTGGPHSPFAQSFLDLLRQNRGVLPTQELFRRLQVQVMTMVERMEVRQVPEYAPIRFAGHEAGDFLFVRKP